MYSRDGGMNKTIRFFIMCRVYLFIFIFLMKSACGGGIRGCVKAARCRFCHINFVDSLFVYFGLWKALDMNFLYKNDFILHIFEYLMGFK